MQSFTSSTYKWLSTSSKRRICSVCWCLLTCCMAYNTPGDWSLWIDWTITWQLCEWITDSFDLLCGVAVDKKRVNMHDAQVTSHWKGSISVTWFGWHRSKCSWNSLIDLRCEYERYCARTVYYILYIVNDIVLYLCNIMVTHWTTCGMDPGLLVTTPESSIYSAGITLQNSGTTLAENIPKSLAFALRFGTVVVF